MEPATKETLIATAVTTIVGALLTRILNGILPDSLQLDIAQCAASIAIGAAIGFLAGSSRAKKHERAAADEKMTELQTEHAAELQAESERLEAEKAALNAAHAEQIAAMRAEFDSRLASLRAEYDASAKEAAASKAKAAKLDKLARTFSCMPEASKELVAEALDNGECIVTVADMPRLNAAAALAEKGIFWSPRTASDRFPIHISPEYVTEIREHRSEWLGM